MNQKQFEFIQPHQFETDNLGGISISYLIWQFFLPTLNIIFLYRIYCLFHFPISKPLNTSRKQPNETVSLHLRNSVLFFNSLDPILRVKWI